MNRQQRRAAVTKPPDDQKYTLVLHTEPLSLDPSEIAVLIATTMHLTALDKIPGFDPTTTRVELTFASGRVGSASLARSASAAEGAS